MSAPTFVVQRLGELRQFAELACRVYYVEQPSNEQVSVVSDSEYDAVIREIAKIEEAHPELVTTSSPTQRVGAPNPKGTVLLKREHPMLSLKNAMNEAEFDAFYAEIKADELEVSCEPKMDGVSCELTYIEGDLVSASLRGDGYEGLDVTQAVRTISAIPLKLIPYKGLVPTKLEVRGEVFMKISVFNEINAELQANGQKPFANPRNAASGSIKLLNPAEVKKRRLSFAAYGSGRFDYISSSAARPDVFLSQTQGQLLELFQLLGIPTVTSVSALSIYQAKELYEETLAGRDKLDYEIDGMVVKVSNLAERRKLGETGTWPRWAIAWKFPPRVASTTHREIIVQVGRTGVLTPVAVFDPVNIGGVMVERATLYNEAGVRRLRLQPGDMIKVQRAGDVIPEVVEVYLPNGPREVWSMPRQCPACSSPVIKDGEGYFCTGGQACKPQLANAVLHFTSREAMRIEGFGETLVDQLIDRELVKKLSDIYELGVLDFLLLDGFGQTSADKLKAEIENSLKDATVSRLIYGLGIPGLGETGAKKAGHLLVAMLDEFLATAAADPNDFWLSDESNEWRKTWETKYRQQLIDVPGIGPKIADAVVAWMKISNNRLVFWEIHSRAQYKAEKAFGEGAMTGQNVVVTGSFSMSRENLEEEMQSRGAKISGSVSKKTTLLLCGDSPGSKLAKATELGVRVISEEQLISEFGLFM